MCQKTQGGAQYLKYNGGIKGNNLQTYIACHEKINKQVLFLKGDGYNGIVRGNMPVLFLLVLMSLSIILPNKSSSIDLVKH